jgi:hypothetical protein
MKRKSNDDTVKIKIDSKDQANDSITMKKKALTAFFSSLNENPSFLTFKKDTKDDTNSINSLYIDDVINTKVNIDSIPFDPVIKSGIDIEANFDLKYFLEENQNHSCYYVYPTNVLQNNLVVTNNDLNAICDYNCLWTIPLETEKDIVNIIKRRKMLFQLSLLSCYDQLKSKSLDYFYIISGNNNDEHVILPGFNAFFYNSNILDSNESSNDVYCILVGVTLGFYRKLISLNTSPSIIEKVKTDDTFSEKILFTKSVLIEGSINCSLVIDLINEIVFPPYKSITSKKYIDPPNIVSPKYFCNSIMKTLQINIIDCSENFNEKYGINENKMHKIRLTGYILPNTYKSLILSLQNCINNSNKSLIINVDDIDNIEINDKSFKTETTTTLIPMIIYTAKNNDKKINQFTSDKYFLIDTLYDDNIIYFAYYKLCSTTTHHNNTSIIIGIDWTENEFEEDNYVNLLNKKSFPIKFVKDDDITNSSSSKDNTIYTLNPIKEYSIYA